jgi:hypothetical protein
MLRFAAMLASLGTLLVNMPAFAITQQQKLETCTFGANSQKLTGEARKAFITKCMADEDQPAAPGAPQQQK